LVDGHRGAIEGLCGATREGDALAGDVYTVVLVSFEGGVEGEGDVGPLAFGGEGYADACALLDEGGEGLGHEALLLGGVGDGGASRDEAEGLTLWLLYVVGHGHECREVV
jgi:hypothetical protein